MFSAVFSITAARPHLWTGESSLCGQCLRNVALALRAHCRVLCVRSAAHLASFCWPRVVVCASQSATLRLRSLVLAILRNRRLFARAHVHRSRTDTAAMWGMTWSLFELCMMPVSSMLIGSLLVLITKASDFDLE
jgi:hypothetical protein